jgi:hypothetical protein
MAADLHDGDRCLEFDRMVLALATSGQRNSTEFARKRDALILWLLERHPATARMLVEIGLFPTPKKARQRLARLARRRFVRLLGTISLSAGRPEHVYGRARWMMKGDTLRHEVLITRLCLRINADEIRRGPGEVDADIRPDAELLINGQRYFLEMDLGTMSYADIVRKRFAKYRPARDLVLWVCPTASRLEGLRRHAEVLREVALFTTLDQAYSHPHTAVWIDFDGERAALPEAQQGGVKPGAKVGAPGGADTEAFALPASGRTATPSLEAIGSGAPTTTEPLKSFPQRRVE